MLTWWPSVLCTVHNDIPHIFFSMFFYFSEIDQSYFHVRENKIFVDLILRKFCHFCGKLLNLQEIFDLLNSSCKVHTKKKNIFKGILKGKCWCYSYEILQIHIIWSALFYFVHRDASKSGFANQYVLPESDLYDCAICSCVADVDWDGKNEILIGTYGQVSL